MDEELTSPSLRDAKKEIRSQHIKQSMVGRSVDEPLSVSLSLFSRRGGAPQSVTPSNVPPLSRLLVFRAPNSLEAVVLLVQPSSAAVVDEHVQEHHRFLCLARTRQALLVSVLVFGRARVPPYFGALPSFQPKMRDAQRSRMTAGGGRGEQRGVKYFETSGTGVRPGGG